MSTHTPGPWEVYEDINGMYGVAWVVGGERGQASLSIEDARVIAAAPDLLEALQDMLAVHGVRWEHARADSSIPTSWVELSDKARAAIAKATGQKGGA